METALDNFPYARQERLRFMESVLLWEGLVQRQRVCEVFGVSANHVTKDLKVYEEAHPGGIEFRPRLRGYVAGPKFKPVYASDDPAEYLTLLQAQAETGSSALASLLGTQDLPSAALPSPAHGVDREVLRLLIQAVRAGSGLELLYYSMTSDQPTERTLWPHSLVHTGLRWHARAFDSQRREFRNFALQRMANPKAVADESPESPRTDGDWINLETLEVVPNPRLNAHQKSIVAHEFGMAADGQTFVWTVELRRCLVAYFAQRYALDAPPPLDPVKHRIVLRNRQAVKAYFMGGDGG